MVASARPASATRPTNESRPSTEISRATLFQLAALAASLEHGSFEQAAARLGVSDKHQIFRAVERAAQHLKLAGLAERIQDEPGTLADVAELGGAATDLLGALTRLHEIAESVNSTVHHVRTLAYPMMLVCFLADAAAEFIDAGLPAGHTRKVVLPDLESHHRRDQGASLLTPLLNGEADVLIGPARRLPGHPTIRSDELYSWRVVAATRADHPLRDLAVVRNGALSVTLDEVAEFPLYLAPVGHQTREMVDGAAPAIGLRIELETSNSQARAAFAQVGLAVALLASDALGDSDHDRSWPVVVGPDGGPLGASHAIYWRADRPERSQVHIDEFVTLVRKHAAKLSARTIPLRSEA